MSRRTKPRRSRVRKREEFDRCIQEFGKSLAPLAYALAEHFIDAYNSRPGFSDFVRDLETQKGERE